MTSWKTSIRRRWPSERGRRISQGIPFCERCKTEIPLWKKYVSKITKGRVKAYCLEHYVDAKGNSLLPTIWNHQK